LSLFFLFSPSSSHGSLSRQSRYTNFINPHKKFQQMKESQFQSIRFQGTHTSQFVTISIVIQILVR
jgi:hypothetical protein